MSYQFEEKDVEVIASWVEEGLKESFVNPLCWNDDDDDDVQAQVQEPCRELDPVPSVIEKKPPKKTNNGIVLETDEDGVWWGIEKFCGRRNDGNGNIHYLIKWENWSKGCTWQPSEDLTYAALQEVEALQAPCTKCAKAPLVAHICWEDMDLHVDDEDESSISTDDFGGFLSDDDDDDDGSGRDDDSLTGDDSRAADDSEYVSTITPRPKTKPQKAHRKKASAAKHVQTTTTKKGKKKRSSGKGHLGRNPAKELAEKNKVTWSIDGGDLGNADYDYCVEEKPRSFDTLAKVLFPGRIVEFKIDCKSKIDTHMSPRIDRPFSGYEFELLCVRHPKKEKQQQRQQQQGDFKFDLGQQKKVSAYYVAVSGPGMPSISLKTELEKLANFASLAPRKVASRLELLLTDAKLLARKYQSHWICNISPNILTEFNEIPLTLGCGFIPNKLAKDLYGGSGQGRQLMAFQVRILSPIYGFFKGMLMTRPGITRIQLPSSMKKVGPSLHDDLKNHAVINFKAAFPSKKCHELLKAWENKRKIVCGEPIPLGVGLYLVEVLGLKKETLFHYDRMTKKDQRKQHHASLVGCADPTNEIPDDFIFVSGYHLMPEFDSKNIFITRNPCVSKDDGRKILVLQEQPLEMSDENWQFLKSLPFGIILFPNSETRELPPLIANGDLDGDKYFICWDKRIMNEIRCIPLSSKKNISKKNNDHERVAEGRTWLECGQLLQADVKARGKIMKLTAVLHSEWKKEPASEKGQAFAEAYKASLDIPKHGGKIQLPKKYWKNIDCALHENLEDFD